MTERSGLSARENMAGRMRMRRDRGNEVETEKFLRSGLEREVRSIRNPFRPLALENERVQCPGWPLIHTLSERERRRNNRG